MCLCDRPVFGFMLKEKVTQQTREQGDDVNPRVMLTFSHKLGTMEYTSIEKLLPQNESLWIVCLVERE